MADINIERKKPVLPWVIAVIVVILIIWGLFALLGNDDDVDVVETPPVATEPVETAPPPVAMDGMPADEAGEIAAMPPPPTEADNTPIPVALIVVKPVDYAGQPVVGTAQVAEVVSDRGFWLEQDGQRIFALIAKSPSMETTVNVEPGQQVRLAGIVYDSSLASQIPGGMEADASAIVQDQPAFLLVDARNIMVVED